MEVGLAGSTRRRIREIRGFDHTQREVGKQALAKELDTSRSQLDRLLDPQNIAVSLDKITGLLAPKNERPLCR